MAEHHDAAPDTLDPDEPHTPFWLTLLGGALFVIATLVILARSGGDEAPGDQADAAQEAHAVAAED